MGWAGSGGGGGNMPKVAARAGSGADHLGRPRRSGDGRRDPQRHPARGGNTFSGQFNFSGANGAMQGSNYTQALKDAGLRAPSELINVYDVNPMGGGRIIRDKLWFYTVFRQVGGRAHGPGHVRATRTPATRMPGRWISTRSKQAFNNSLERQATIAADVAGDAAQQVQRPLVRAVQRRELRRAAAPATRRRRKRRAGCSTSRPASRTRPGRRRSRAGCWSRPAGACIRRGTASAPRNDGTSNPTDDPALEQRRAGAASIPNLISRMPRAPGKAASPLADRDAGQPARVAVVCHRRAQHEVRLPGRVQQSVPDLPDTSPRSCRSGRTTACRTS